MLSWLRGKASSSATNGSGSGDSSTRAAGQQARRSVRPAHLTGRAGIPSDDRGERGPPSSSIPRLRLPNADDPESIIFGAAAARPQTAASERPGTGAASRAASAGARGGRPTSAAAERGEVVIAVPRAVRVGQSAAVFKEGQLHKLKGRGLGRSWKPQWFTLKQDALYYSPHKQFSHLSKKISLFRATVGSAEHHTRRANALCVIDAKTNAVHVMAAESWDAVEEWCVALLRTKYSLERVEGGSLEVSAVPPRRRKPAGRRGRSGETAAREQPGDAAGAASALGGRGAQGAVGERLLLTDESADGLSSGDEASGAGASSSDAASAPTASLDTDGIVAGFVEHRRDLPWGAVAAALHSHGSPPPPFSPDRRLGPKLSPPLPEHAPHPTSPGSPSAPALPRTLRTKPCGVAGVAGGAGSASLAGAASARGVPSAPVLMRAARSGRVAEVRAAIRALCPPGGGAPVAREALTDALVAAAAAGLLDVCFCLLEHGADARARGTGGASAGEVLAEGSLGPQRRALHVMGFPDAAACAAALLESRGEVSRAVLALS